MRHKEQVLCLSSGANLIQDVRVKNKMETNSVVEVRILLSSLLLCFLVFSSSYLTIILLIEGFLFLSSLTYSERGAALLSIRAG